MVPRTDRPLTSRSGGPPEQVWPVAPSFSDLPALELPSPWLLPERLERPADGAPTMVLPTRDAEIAAARPGSPGAAVPEPIAPPAGEPAPAAEPTPRAESEPVRPAPAPAAGPPRPAAATPAGRRWLPVAAAIEGILILGLLAALIALAGRAPAALPAAPPAPAATARAAPAPTADPALAGEYAGRVKALLVEAEANYLDWVRTGRNLEATVAGYRAAIAADPANAVARWQIARMREILRGEAVRHLDVGNTAAGCELARQAALITPEDPAIRELLSRCPTPEAPVATTAPATPAPGPPG